MISRKSFGSDNHSGVHPKVLAAIAAADTGSAHAYGDDEVTRRLEKRFCEVFGPQARVFPVFNGTGANVLGLSALLRPYEAVVCADTSHIDTDECAAPERFVGSKLLTVPTTDGKLCPEAVLTRLGGRGDQHRAQPRVLSLTQATELGTCYTLHELKELVELARSHGLWVHMDGARLANAAAFLGCSLRDLTEGVDVLSFGGTKNGALAAEAVVVFRPEIAERFPFVRKQGMQLASKMRFLSAQLLALLDDDLWLRNAATANAMARRLAAGLEGLSTVSVRYPVEANGVFATLHPDHIAQLQQRWDFYVWDEAEHVVRWMTAFDTTEEDVDAFLADIRRTCSR